MLLLAVCYHLLCVASLRLVVLSPIMNILESQNLPDLPVAQRCLPLSHLPRNLCVRTVLLQKLRSRNLRRDGSVRSIEDLESQSTLLDRQITDLAQISGINIRPGIPLPRHGIVDIGFEISGVLMRLDDISNSESVDVALETAGECSCGLLAADLGESVGVHGVDIVILLQWEGVVVGISLGEADAVSGLAACNDDLLDAELAGCFNDVVCGSHVRCKAFVVWNKHVTSVGCEVDDNIWWWLGVSLLVAVRHIIVRR